MPLCHNGDSRLVLVDGKPVVIPNQFPRAPVVTSSVVAEWLDMTTTTTTTATDVINPEGIEWLSKLLRDRTTTTCNHLGGSQWSLMANNNQQPIGTLTSLQSGFKMFTTAGNREMFVGDEKPAKIFLADDGGLSTLIVSLY